MTFIGTLGLVYIFPAQKMNVYKILQTEDETVLTDSSKACSTAITYPSSVCPSLMGVARAIKVGGHQ